MKTFLAALLLLASPSAFAQVCGVATATCTCTCPNTPVPDAGTVVDGGFDGGVRPDAGFDAGTVADAGTPDAGTMVDAGSSVDGGTQLLGFYTQGNKIMKDGRPWMGKGVNIFDVRSCNNCSYGPPNWAAVRRNIDEVTSWGANFIRLDLEAYAAADGRVHWANAISDEVYLTGLVETVRHTNTKPNVAILVSVWIDPSLNANGLPTGDTAKLWTKMATALNQFPNVWYGVANEPGVPYSYNNDPEVWGSMSVVVNAIRATEGTGQKHIIAVQGTRQWARQLGYYVTRPIQSPNIVYETHIYDPISEFANLLAPAASIPVIIGEFGPGEQMDTPAAIELINQANARGIPWLSWALHHRCPPNMVTAGSCGTTFPSLTSWGNVVKSAVAP